MNRLGKLSLLLIAIFAIFLIIILYVYHRRTPEPTVEKPIKVLVATRNIPAGTPLKSPDMKWIKWPKQAFSPLFLTEDETKIEDIIGSITKQNINEGYPITLAALIPKGEVSALTRTIQPGKRAFTIDISIASALAGLVKPGDRVDIILTYNISTSRTKKEFASETILHHLKVIAVDQAILYDESSAVSSKISRSYSSSTRVTLEVTPKEAEILAAATSIGTLSLSLTLPGEEIQSINAAQEDVTLIHGETQERAINHG